MSVYGSLAFLELSQSANHRGSRGCFILVSSRIGLGLLNRHTYKNILHSYETQKYYIKMRTPSRIYVEGCWKRP